MLGKFGLPVDSGCQLALPDTGGHSKPENSYSRERLAYLSSEGPVSHCIPTRLQRLIARGLGIVALALSTACVHTPAAKGSDEKAARLLRAEVEAINRQMEEAFNRKDMLAVAKYYADDARMIGPRGQEVRGRAAIDAYWLGVHGPKTWRLEAFDIGGSRDEMYQFGRSTLIQAGTAGDRMSVANFVVIWKRGPDGQLRISLDFYH
jgi:ketosteroid isomerase-like protein